jgi:uncharacterized metal-binding protein
MVRAGNQRVKRRNSPAICGGCTGNNLYPTRRRSSSQNIHLRCFRIRAIVISLFDEIRTQNQRNIMTSKSDTGGGAKLFYACSGGSDVGHLADLGAREAARRGAGKMHCLAGIGGRVESMLATARGAAKILAIDGCPQNCARKTLEQAGITGFAHLQLHDLGLVKGKGEPTPERVWLVAEKAVENLR